MAATPETIFKEARSAALKAVSDTAAVKPENVNGFDCGFAWVSLRPARGPFVTWLKGQIKAAGGPRTIEAHKFGSFSLSGGWQFWHPGEHRGQSIHLHEAGAKAFAQVLQAHGLNAHASSRLD